MWKELELELKKDYFINLMNEIDKREKKVLIFPEKELRFRAFELTPLDNVKVVILGQDPYYKKGYADGLAFSSKGDIIPKSLINIFNELESDLNIKKTSADLTTWAKEGVLLLNTILTVEEDNDLAHKGLGWEKFILKVFDILKTKKHIVYILWGNDAIKYEKYIKKDDNLIIKSSHPSPLSYYRTFKGSRPFSKANNYLKENNRKEVSWL